MTCPGSRIPIEPSAVGCASAAEATKHEVTCWCCQRRLCPEMTERGLELPLHNLPASKVGK